MINADSESMFLNDLFGDGLDTDAILDNAAGIGQADPATTGLTEFDMPDSPQDGLAWNAEDGAGLPESMQQAAQATPSSAPPVSSGQGAAATSGATGGRASKPPSSRSGGGGGRRRSSQAAQAAQAVHAAQAAQAAVSAGQGQGASEGDGGSGAYGDPNAEQARMAMQVGQEEHARACFLCSDMYIFAVAHCYALSFRRFLSGLLLTGASQCPHRTSCIGRLQLTRLWPRD